MRFVCSVCDGDSDGDDFVSQVTDAGAVDDSDGTDFGDSGSSLRRRMARKRRLVAVR